MSMLGIVPEQPQARQPSALDNAAKVLGIVGSLAGAGAGVANAMNGATNAATNSDWLAMQKAKDMANLTTPMPNNGMPQQ